MHTIISFIDQASQINYPQLLLILLLPDTVLSNVETFILEYKHCTVAVLLVATVVVHTFKMHKNIIKQGTLSLEFTTLLFF